MEFSLSARERSALELLVATAKDVRQLKRAQALLAVAAGETVSAVASRLKVVRNTIYNWVMRFRKRSVGIAERLLDSDRCGRPNDLIQSVQAAFAGIAGEQAGRLRLSLCRVDGRAAAIASARAVDRIIEAASRWNGQTWRDHLRSIRRTWRGWRIILFLDRGTPHTAKASREMASEMDIELRWLPTACPELNPIESLWRWLKGAILCNHQSDHFDQTVEQAAEALRELKNKNALSTAGILSKYFWLAT